VLPSAPLLHALLGHLLPEPMRPLRISLIKLRLRDLMDLQGQQMPFLQRLEWFLRRSSYGWTLQPRGSSCWQRA
jgi:hypothetical protein